LEFERVVPDKTLQVVQVSPGSGTEVENHESAIALHYMYYNFARIHQTLPVTPAMEAGVADHVWSLEEIVGLLA
jgi:hypothetical protein